MQSKKQSFIILFWVLAIILTESGYYLLPCSRFSFYATQLGGIVFGALLAINLLPLKTEDIINKKENA